MARNRRQLGRYAAPQQRMWLEIAGQRRLRRLHRQLAARREVLHRWSALLDDLDKDVSRRLSDLGGGEDGYNTQSDDVNEPERTRYAQRGRAKQAAGHLNLSPGWGLHEEDDEDEEDSFEDEDEEAEEDEEDDEAMTKSPVETYFEGGTWRSRHQGAGKPFASGGTKAEQVELGRERARRMAVEHIIKKRDGSISERNSYGRDPRSRKG